MKRLIFGCELQTDELEDLFADPAVANTLVELGAGVSLGLVDLSAGRAEVIRQLNEAGIPVTAWQLLSKEQGYWFNADNAPQAREMRPSGLVARVGDAGSPTTFQTIAQRETIGETPPAPPVQQGER